MKMCPMVIAQHTVANCDRTVCMWPSSDKMVAASAAKKSYKNYKKPQIKVL